MSAVDDVAASLGVEARALRAVLSVESAGSGLGPDGRPTVRLECAILQGFSVGYPWQGTKAQQYAQLGNAVPPPLAAALLGAIPR